MVAGQQLAGPSQERFSARAEVDQRSRAIARRATTNCRQMLGQSVGLAPVMFWIKYRPRAVRKTSRSRRAEPSELTSMILSANPVQRASETRLLARAMVTPYADRRIDWGTTCVLHEPSAKRCTLGQAAQRDDARAAERLGARQETIALLSLQRRDVQSSRAGVALARDGTPCSALPQAQTKGSSVR